MMSDELLDIEPQELQFIVELKKQSSCSVRLFNKSDQYVAFKVKTTSPKRYCVRPNVGIIEPKSTTDFLVTMQAPPRIIAPPDMACKDKFLIQSTVVALGTSEEDITSSLFAKDNGKYVGERKLRVILTSPPNSPILLPINGVHNEVPAYDTSPPKDQDLHGSKNISTQPEVTEDIAKSKLEEELELVKDIKNMKSKISELELKLNEAEVTISKLIEDRKLTTQESRTLQEELSLLRTKTCVRRVQVGFPFLFVCMVALISAALGYLWRC